MMSELKNIFLFIYFLFFIVSRYYQLLSVIIIKIDYQTQTT